VRLQGGLSYLTHVLTATAHGHATLDHEGAASHKGKTSSKLAPKQASYCLPQPLGARSFASDTAGDRAVCCSQALRARCRASVTLCISICAAWTSGHVLPEVQLGRLTGQQRRCRMNPCWQAEYVLA